MYCFGALMMGALDAPLQSVRQKYSCMYEHAANCNPTVQTIFWKTLLVLHFSLLLRPFGSLGPQFIELPELL